MLYESPWVPEVIKCSLQGVTLVCPPHTAHSMLKNFLNGPDDGKSTLECFIQICNVENGINQVKIYKDVSICSPWPQCSETQK